MKKTTLVLQILILALLFTNISTAQYLISQKKESKKHSLYKPVLKFRPMITSGASMGLNLGFASIEGELGFAIGAFAELRSKEIAFVPQANYWNVNKQSNFELAGLARLYLTQKAVAPYIDGGLGINFYKSDNTDFTKLSILAGGGVELSNLGTSFNLLFDGKYKLIINDKGNLSGFVFTAGMKFPFK